jgi:hypothetical protein
VEEANHGKLLWDEGSHLKSHGYATSTGEPHLFIIDMDSKEQLGTYDFSSDVKNTTCDGTHAIAYSSQNNHLYLECAGPGGVIEFDVQDPVKPVFVAQHESATGALYETPEALDTSYVVASDKGGNKLHLFAPNGNGEASSIEFVVDVPGHPSTVSYYPRNRNGDASDWNICMPLTENTNRNHMADDGTIVCDGYNGCSGASNPRDVANGICHYDETGRTLQQATIEEIESVRAGEAPFGSVCAHCTKESNYEDGVCDCTPFCGSCADDNYDASNSGVMCVNLKDVITGKTNQAKLIKGAGAVLQGDPYAYSPQCGFGRTYRAHKSGGVYDASVANFPSNSLQIINMATETLKCGVDLPGAPSRVLYVPPQEGQNNNSSTKNPLSSGGIAGITIGSIAVVAITGFFLYQRRAGSKDSSFTGGGAQASGANGDVL